MVGVFFVGAGSAPQEHMSTMLHSGKIIKTADVLKCDRLEVPQE